MRGDIVYRIHGRHRGRAQDSYFGAFRTEREAREEVARLVAREMHGTNWAQRYHDLGFDVRPFTVETDFEIPPLPNPRDAFVVEATPQPNGPGVWDGSRIDIFRRSDAPGARTLVASYDRDYGLLGTFEPFRQRGREFALVAPRYTKTAVLDLATGAVIAEEHEDAPGSGFCPVGFYVPDWWDVHDGSIIPGSESWRAEHEWVSGDSGFVWGCHWGDDTSWKVQYLDLRRITEGVIVREERFGYVSLATGSWMPPWADATRPVSVRTAPPPFIRVRPTRGGWRVGFDVKLEFDVASGRVDPTQLRSLRSEPTE